MKKAKTPPSIHVIRALEAVGGSVMDARAQIHSILITQVRFVGHIKQLAERYGLHYLRSKRMRKLELIQWIMDNHPATKQG